MKFPVTVKRLIDGNLGCDSSTLIRSRTGAFFNHLITVQAGLEFLIWRRGNGLHIAAVHHQWFMLQYHGQKDDGQRNQHSGTDQSTFQFMTHVRTC